MAVLGLRRTGFVPGVLSQASLRLSGVDDIRFYGRARWRVAFRRVTTGSMFQLDLTGRCPANSQKESSRITIWCGRKRKMRCTATWRCRVLGPAAGGRKAETRISSSRSCPLARAPNRLLLSRTTEPSPHRAHLFKLSPQVEAASSHICTTAPAPTPLHHTHECLVPEPGSCAVSALHRPHVAHQPWKDVTPHPDPIHHILKDGARAGAYYAPNHPSKDTAAEGPAVMVLRCNSTLININILRARCVLQIPCQPTVHTLRDQWQYPIFRLLFGCRVRYTRALF
jgi:hypothetical protein